jgi:hypothetical protein
MTNLQQSAQYRDWGLAVDQLASPAEVIVIHRSVGIARLPYVAEAAALIAWLVQVGVPEGTAKALTVQLVAKVASPKVSRVGLLAHPN